MSNRKHPLSCVPIYSSGMVTRRPPAGRYTMRWTTCGEAFPHWENGPRTTQSRAWITDVCDEGIQPPNAALSSGGTTEPQNGDGMSPPSA